MVVEAVATPTSKSGRTIGTVIVEMWISASDKSATPVERRNLRVPVVVVVAQGPCVEDHEVEAREADPIKYWL